MRGSSPRMTQSRTRVHEHPRPAYRRRARSCRPLALAGCAGAPCAQPRRRGEPRGACRHCAHGAAGAMDFAAPLRRCILGRHPHAARLRQGALVRHRRQPPRPVRPHPLRRPCLASGGRGGHHGEPPDRRLLRRHRGLFRRPHRRHHDALGRRPLFAAVPVLRDPADGVFWPPHRADLCGDRSRRMAHHGAHRARPDIVDQAPRIHRGGPCGRRLRRKDYPAPHHPEQHRPGDRLCDPHDPAGHPDRGLPVLPRSRRAGALYELGRTYRRRGRRDGDRALDAGVPGYFPRHHPVLLQLHRRRAARRPRPQGPLSMTVLLEVTNLNTRFDTPDGEVKAVNDVSFAIDEGETVGVVGESGAGKSQAFLTVMGLLAANGRATGSARFRGAELLGLAPAELNRIRGSRIAMIFQDAMTSLNPYLRISRQMTEVLVTHRGMNESEARKAAVAMLDRVRIPEAKRRFDTYPHEFSGGMRQRVMIAMALLCEPELLIADEPTTALDVTIQAQILDLMRDLKRGGRTAIVMITHAMGVVAGLCDRVLVMYGGRIVEEAPVRDIFYDPQHPYTHGLLRSMPRLDEAIMAELRTIPGQPPNLQHLPPGCAFHERCF